MKKHLGGEKAIFKSPIQTNENILQPLVSKITPKTSKREKIQNISQVTKLWTEIKWFNTHKNTKCFAVPTRSS